MNIEEKYLIQQELGGVKTRKFSRVFKGINKANGDEIVLKTIIKKSSNLIVQDRLKAEASFTFTKKGLPKVLEYFETENELILVKSFEKGIPLNTYLAQFKQKERALELIPILEKLSNLLNFIHEQDILHLDLKPSNIIVAKENQELCVSLIDFGLAYNQKSLEKRSTLFPLGTAAPECLLNFLSIADRRSDYFSLGVSIWQSIEGKLPLIHPNPSITTNLQLTYPLPDATNLNKAQNSCLQKLAYKHSFGLPPNKMKEEDVLHFLIQARNNRYAHLEQFILDWKAATKLKKRWFLF